VYYVGHMLQHMGQGSLAGKRVAISGSGNVAQYAALKCIELGAHVVSMSDSRGSLVAQGDNAFTPQQVHDIAALKVQRKALTDFSAGDKFKWQRPWVHVGKVDVALPCATQNEVSEDEAKALVSAGALIVAEGSNMGCTQEAVDYMEAQRQTGKGKSAWYAPGKASNCGGVAVSGLEMAQNSQVSNP
jgi:glutamate dehydrogenase (NADP+)